VFLISRGRLIRTLDQQNKNKPRKQEKVCCGSKVFLNIEKFGANLSFSPPLSSVHLFQSFFRNLTPFMTKQGYLVLCFPYFADISNLKNVWAGPEVNSHLSEVLKMKKNGCRWATFKYLCTCLPAVFGGHLVW
jgi:hypothetical protein